MTTTWFTKEAGSDISPSSEDPSMMLMGSDTPDWIRLPVELGGQSVRVASVRRDRCPRCPAYVRHFILEGEVNVAECAEDGFLWYRQR